MPIFVCMLMFEYRIKLNCNDDSGILDGGMKSFYRKRKLCYSRDRYQHDALYKRRKFSDHSLVATSDGGFSSESVCNSPEKGLSGDKNEPVALFNGGQFLLILPFLLVFFISLVFWSVFF